MAQPKIAQLETVHHYHRSTRGYAMRNLMLLSILSFLLGGCTFVKLTAAGENVAVLQASEVANCTLNTPTSTLTANVPNKVVVNRESARVQQDLRTLARNRAAVLGGDTIVATTEPRNGEQTFNIYRCRR
ncbi:MAG: DUF4156 domain-containing protein [Burkholderiales bacterium]